MSNVAAMHDPDAPENKTHWKKLINPDYIGAYALSPGLDMTVTIASVSREMIVSTGGKKEECTVAKLMGQKPLILNVTNSKSIAKLYGPFIEDWAGKRITLYASTTKLAGETVECLRIRPSAPTDKPRRKALTDERLENAIAAIKDGTYTLAQMDAFDLTDEQTLRLNAALEATE
jgi:hypothetical protein